MKKVNTKEELLEELKKYEGILNSPMINYLNSLIELEFSVVRDYITENDREILSELDLYKEVAIYNIYNKALKLFEGRNVKISDNSEGREGLRVYAEADIVKEPIGVFDFSYLEGPLSLKVPKGYKTTRIGEINLYKTIGCKTQRQEEMDRILKTLERLYDEKNPYHDAPGVFGGPGSQWAFHHADKVREYEQKFKELDEKKELTEEDNETIKITEEYHEMLMEDLGLTNKDFQPKQKQGLLEGIIEKQVLDPETLRKRLAGEEESELHKTYTKKLPGLEIRNNITYI